MNEKGNKEWSLRYSKSLQTLIGWSKVEKASILMSSTQTFLTDNVVEITHNVTWQHSKSNIKRISADGWMKNISDGGTDRKLHT